MQLKLDKTIVLVAAIKALQEVSNWTPEAESVIQRIVDVLTYRKSVYIRSVILSAYEYDILEAFLEEV